MATKEERLKKVHYRAKRDFNAVQAACRDERKQCLQDRRFYSIAGAQWEDKFGEQFANKPKFEVNKIHLSVIRIFNEYRANRITVDFVSKEGQEYDELADVCDGLYRADEQHSVAEEAYDNAFEEAVGGGFGAWRLRADYVDEESEESDEQHICIEPIYDADSCVFFSLNSKRQDKKDADACWVLTAMPVQDYIDEYNDDPASWPKDISNSEFDWATDDVVYIAEYYKIEEKPETVFIFEELSGEETRVHERDIDNERPMLEAMGAREVRQKRIKKKRVHKYLMSGSKVLEDCGLIAGCNIPIVPVYGKRWYVDNIERCMGHVRLAKDAQRLKNMQLSRLGEIAALSPIEKPMFTPEQLAGHQTMWAEDNIKNYPYLFVNPVTDQTGAETIAGPVGYTKPPQVAPALSALLQLTEDDIKDVLGNQQNGEEIVGNISTQTATLIQNRLDMQTFIYLSNMAKAIKRSGEIWLGMARDVFIESGRKLKTVDVQGEAGHIKLNEPFETESGKTEYRNNLKNARFDIAVDVGPSSSTKRAATVNSLTQMMAASQDAETQQILSAMIMMNMEGEGIGEVRQYFRKKLIMLGVIEPNEQELEELNQARENQAPSPQDQYLQAAAENEQAKAAKTQVEIVSEQADADKTRAQTAEIMEKLKIDKFNAALNAVEKIKPRVNPPSNAYQ